MAAGSVASTSTSREDFRRATVPPESVLQQAPPIAFGVNPEDSTTTHGQVRLCRTLGRLPAN